MLWRWPWIQKKLILDQFCKTFNINKCNIPPHYSRWMGLLKDQHRNLLQCLWYMITHIGGLQTHRSLYFLFIKQLRKFNDSVSLSTVLIDVYSIDFSLTFQNQCAILRTSFTCVSVIFRFITTSTLTLLIDKKRCWSNNMRLLKISAWKLVIVFEINQNFNFNLVGDFSLYSGPWYGDRP